MDQVRPKLVVFSDIRGDFRLLLALLTQVAKVAEYKDDHWTWSVQDTTVVCTGNYINRFAEKGYNRLTVSTADAVADQRRILHAFRSLHQHPDRQKFRNSIIVLAGDQELGALLMRGDYDLYAMAQPDNIHDQDLYRVFVEEELVPFCASQGVMVGWGGEGVMTYASRGTLEREWLKSSRFESLKSMNRYWQQMLRTQQLNRLRVFAEPNSPLFSTKLSLQPHTWRDEDEEFVTQWLGADVNPRFLLSVTPIQILQRESLDLRLRAPHCEPVKPDSLLQNIQDPANRLLQPTVLLSPGNDATDQVYHIHNCMADVFCQFPTDGRQPHTMEFSLVRNRHNDPLYTTCRNQQMNDLSYSYYVSQRAYSVCLPPEHLLPLKDIKLSDADLVQMQPFLDDAIVLASDVNAPEIKQVGMLLFAEDMRSVLMLKHPISAMGDEYFDFPVGPRVISEHVWPTMTHVLRQRTNIEHPQQSWPGVTVDYQTHFRLWLRKLHSHSSVHVDHEVAHWVPVTKLYTMSLTPSTLGVLCALARTGYLPKFQGFQQKCPAWATRNPIPESKLPERWW